MSLHSLPLFVRLAGRPVILVGEGEAADAKRRLLERADAVVVDEDGTPLPPVRPEPVEGRVPSETAAALARPSTGSGRTGDGATLAIVVDDDAAVARLKARGVLVNAVDRPELCDFTLPAIVDRAPVIVAIGTGGASAGLAAALRQRLEAILPASLGRLADALHAARDAWRARYPDAGERRRAIAAALAQGSPLDLFSLPSPSGEGLGWGLSASPDLCETSPTPNPSPEGEGLMVAIALTSPDPEELTLRQARGLANADWVTHGADVPRAILDRARADAARRETPAPPSPIPAGRGVDVRMA